MPWYSLLTSHHCANQADCIEGRLLINPGSATGAFNSLHEEVVPSFVLMDVTGKKVGAPAQQIWPWGWALIVKPAYRLPVWHQLQTHWQ